MRGSSPRTTGRRERRRVPGQRGVRPQNFFRVQVATAFDRNSLQRAVPGQSGLQQFFTHRGRAFCLYVVLGSLLKFFTFPLILLTFGLFLLVINGFLLWLTDKMLDGIEIKGFGPLATMTVLISLGHVLVSWIVGR